jgi:beta-glucosidase
MKSNRKANKLSRRNFLKTALTATGGLAVASCSRSTSTVFPSSVPSLPATAPATAIGSGAPVYTDATRPVEERVDDLVERMTLDEKISQLGSEAPEISRLGISKYNWWNEALHGVARAGIATVFPQVIGLAATWNTDLIHQMAGVISDEGRAKHHEAVRGGVHDLYTGLTFFCPNVNIFRDPRWGRGQETYGEDPYLTSRLAVNFIRGMQGDDPRYLKTVATAKHFAVHSGPEKERHSFNAVVSESDLRMTYLPAFQACITEAKAGSIMGAYNEVNGEACCASPTLLREILRGEWGFEGYVVSDCGAIDDIFLSHGLAKSTAEAAAMALKAGCDLECGCTYGIPCDYNRLKTAADQGMVTEAEITQSVKRLFAARFRLGEFDPPEQVAFAQIPMSVVDSPEHRALALEVARQSLVLLRNEKSLLPLDKDKLTSIAVIGPNADETMVLTGNYMGSPTAPVSVLAGIQALVPPGIKVNYARGSDIMDTLDNGIAEAVKAAKASQVAVVVVGLSQEVEGEQGQQEGNPPGVVSLGDRTTLDLPAAQEQLVEAVYATGTPVVLVLINGSAVSIHWANAHIPAILEAWYPGQAGGTAVAEALFGLTNPGGRLPVTFYQSESDLPDFRDYNMKNRTYRYFTGKPLYAFGYGLSYTTFAYSNLQITPAAAKPGEPVAVSADVENTGTLAGDEVVQLYLKDVEATLPVPNLQLQGFARVPLAPGEKRTVKFSLAAAQLSAVNADGKWVLEPGVFAVWVGGVQPDLVSNILPANLLAGEFSVKA